ncbi:hypothetical protein [Alcaligenes faecalis]|uniref:hypothetical protein n=1 Tax=Alcaligenes faecalis TaxID=511 RepID=UPI0018EF0374|nr:hypothetical protein [Alcaligenes faecalis]
MKHKHTPGPWGNHLVDDTVVVIPRRPLPQQVSVLGHSEVADGEDYANARLIAAAPELLKCLIELEEAARQVQAKEMDRHSIDVERRNARAAIAKATGTTHE